MARFKQIDILRALAVLLVMGRHMTLCPEETSAIFHRITFLWARVGWIGVDLFFVLSGFLVSGLLFREHEKYHELRIGHFLIRRGFKIYPPFWLLIGATFVTGLLLHKPMTWQAFASELLFVQNYGPALWHHTWSLAVEEHFYLLLALGFYVLARGRAARPFRCIPVVFVGVALLCLMLRIFVGTQGSFGFRSHVYASHLRLDGLLFGVLLSYWYHRQPIQFLALAQRFRFLLASLGALLLFPGFFLPLETAPSICTYGFTLIYLGSGGLLVAALGCRPPVTRIANGAAYLGSHSYSIYLWHMPVAVWGGALLARLPGPYNSWFLYAFVYLAGTVVLGTTMATLIEFPVLRLRDRLFPSRGAPLSTAATGGRADAAAQP